MGGEGAGTGRRRPPGAVRQLLERRSDIGTLADITNLLGVVSESQHVIKGGVILVGTLEVFRAPTRAAAS